LLFSLFISPLRKPDSLNLRGKRLSTPVCTTGLTQPTSSTSFTWTWEKREYAVLGQYRGTSGLWGKRHRGIGTWFEWLRGRWHIATLQHKGGNPMALVLPIQGVVGDQRGTGHRVCRRHTRRQRYWATIDWHLSLRFDKERFRLYNISVIEPV
jgi:hypothetical protein